MRCRNIKYAFFIHDVLPKCEPLARLLFIGLWCMSDRRGRLEERPQKIRLQLMPCDPCDIEALLGQLEQHGFIIRYTTNGLKCIQVVNFLKHQHPHFKEPPSRFLPPPGYVDEKPKRKKPEASPEPTKGKTKKSPRHASDRPDTRPADTLIPDIRNAESSLVSDSGKPSRKRPAVELAHLSISTLPREWAEWAHHVMGWDHHVVYDVWVAFRDYWLSRKGKAGQKSDWAATWRNWCRQQKIHNGGKHAAAFNHTTQGARPSKSERFKHALIDSTIDELGAE